MKDPRSTDPSDLRRQRDLVAAHLAWLDREIARQSGALPTAPSAGPEASRTGAPAPDRDPATDPFEAELSSLSAASNLRRQRLGCILIAILLTVLGVFLIWGLPEFLY